MKRNQSRNRIGSKNRRSVIKALGVGAVGTLALPNTAFAESDDLGTSSTNPVVELDLPAEPHEVPGDGVPKISKNNSYSWDFKHTAGEGWHYGRERTSRSGAGEGISYATDGVRARMSGSRYSTREFSQAYVAYFDFVAETDSILFDAVIDINAKLERDTMFGGFSHDNSELEANKGESDEQKSDQLESEQSNNVRTTAVQAIPIALGTASLLTGLASLKDNSNHVGFEIGYFMQNLSRDSNLTRRDSRGDIYDELLTSDGNVNVDERFQRRQTVDNLVEGDTYRVGLAYAASLSGIRRSANELDMNSISDSRQLKLENFSVEGR